MSDASRVCAPGFSIAASPRPSLPPSRKRRRALRSSFTWLANRHLLASARGPPARALCAPQSGRPPDPAERPQRRLPRHRHLAVGRRASRPTSGPRSGAPVTIGKTPGRVVRHLEEGIRDRVHPPAASRLSRRERHRRVNAATPRRRVAGDKFQTFHCPASPRPLGARARPGLTATAPTAAQKPADAARTALMPRTLIQIAVGYDFSRIRL